MCPIYLSIFLSLHLCVLPTLPIYLVCLICLFLSYETFSMDWQGLTKSPIQKTKMRCRRLNLFLLSVAIGRRRHMADTHPMWDARDSGHHGHTRYGGYRFHMPRSAKLCGTQLTRGRKPSLSQSSAEARHAHRSCTHGRSTFTSRRCLHSRLAWLQLTQ